MTFPDACVGKQLPEPTGLLIRNVCLTGYIALGIAESSGVSELWEEKLHF